jgi:hypothetical protein
MLSTSAGYTTGTQLVDPRVPRDSAMGLHHSTPCSIFVRAGLLTFVYSRFFSYCNVSLLVDTEVQLYIYHAKYVSL